jgi:translation initiation factor IF-2
VNPIGLSGTPVAGDEFIVAENDSLAREVADFRGQSKRESEIATHARGSLEQMLARIQEGEAQELPIIVKSDVHGTCEAIVGSLERIGTEEVKVRMLHAGVGGINESDVTLASATEAIIIGFNVRANPQARDLARRDGVDIRYYAIIYNVVDDMKAVLTGLLAPEQREKFLGNAEIREVFNITKVGKVGGCMVTEGMVRRGAKVRLLRDDVLRGRRDRPHPVGTRRGSAATPRCGSRLDRPTRHQTRTRNEPKPGQASEPATVARRRGTAPCVGAGLGARRFQRS